MKREREEGEYEAFDMVDCLLLLSKVGDHQYKRSEKQPPKAKDSFPLPGSRKVFVCKTCNRQFSSFQALGGHRASHKKPRFMDDMSGEMQSMPVKPKAHECLVCGLEFPIGQALGGHMRRHRNNIEPVTRATEMVDVIKKTRKRVFGLDLNLTPVENDLKLQLMIPIVDCFN